MQYEEMGNEFYWSDLRLPAGRIHLVLQSLVRYKYCVKTKEETDTTYSHDINHRPDGKGIFKTKVAPKNYQNHQPFIITHQLTQQVKRENSGLKRASELTQNPDLFLGGLSSSKRHSIIADLSTWSIVVWKCTNTVYQSHAVVTWGGQTHYHQ